MSSSFVIKALLICLILLIARSAFLARGNINGISPIGFAAVVFDEKEAITNCDTTSTIPAASNRHNDDDDDSSETDKNINPLRGINAPEIVAPVQVGLPANPPPSTIDRSWCPTATCHNSAICRPCDRRYLILLCTGRSGSTTLMNMMDYLPGVRVSGENNNILMRMKQTVLDETLEHRYFSSEQNLKNRSAAWRHNQLIPGSHACVTQTMVQTMNPPPGMNIRNGNDNNSHNNNNHNNGTTTDSTTTGTTTAGITTETIVDDDRDTILGFKNIRFHTAQNLTAAVEYVNEALPCARILINIRSNTTAQALSLQNTFNFISASSDMVQAENDNMKRMAELFGPDKAMLLDSTEWTKNVSALNVALEWMGFSKECYFEKVLQLNTVDRYGFSGSADLDPPSPDCRYLGGGQ